MDAAFIPQNYKQTEPFTCGAAALITALQFLGRLSVPPTRTLELALWRRANTIYMGEGMPGCGPYGLGCIALDYGCAAALFTSKELRHFENWNREAGRGDAADLIEDHDRARFLSLGGHIHPEAALPYASSTEKHALLALEGGDDLAMAHWVCFVEDGDGLYLRLDPEEQGEPAPYGLEDIRHRAHYDGQRVFLWLSN